MKSCIIDASSSILLFKSGLISDLVECYDTHMSSCVRGEVTVAGYPGSERFRELFSQGAISVHNVPDSGSAGADCYVPAPGLGDGERETIILYEHGIGDFVIIDDRKGAIRCRSRDIPYINALLVPRILYFAGMLDQDRMERAFEDLVSLGRYSGWIIDFADSASKEKLHIFFPG